jgi:hypothetical protein
LPLVAQHKLLVVTLVMVTLLQVAEEQTLAQPLVVQEVVQILQADLLVQLIIGVSPQVLVARLP